MPKIPSLALGKKGNLSKFMNWDRISKIYMQKEKGGRYQCTQFSTCTINHQVPGPELTVKPIGTMVQDSGKKREKSCIKKKKKEGNVSNIKADPHTKKLEAVLKHKHRAKKKREQC